LIKSMCLFFETICIKNSVPQKLDLHNERLNRTRFEVLGADNPIDISNHINLPNELKAIQRVKCRIVYSSKIDDISFEVYKHKTINRIKLVEHNDIDYGYKYSDRSVIELLYSNRGEADEILVSKNGYLTDTSIHNIALFNGNEWHTPSEPLLRGVQREYLLLKKLIVSKPIKITGLANYSRIKLFNAMNDWNECVELSLSNIII
jgi:4-amino-4-deoxychorismate lyase